jgi:F-type H+-transporting ATPase subunit a
VEHPFLIIVWLLEKIGLGEFAHNYTYIVYEWFVILILIILSLIAVKSIQMVPGKIQNVFEVIISGLENFIVSITGEEGRWLFPILGTVFIFIAACNLIGLIPGCLPPTADLNTTLSCALVVVISTHIVGIKYHGAKYIKHFLGPIWWLSPLIFVIELIGHLARIMSLSIRLFGNMVGHEFVLAVLFMLAGAFFVPLPIMALGVFVALVQAFVFFLLSIIYFQGAMEHAH